jgi:hypothetical protein
MITFDHVGLSAGALDLGLAAFAERTGLGLPPGGKHPLMGTHNCVTAMGPDRFLELIAVDPEAQAPDRPRWFGLDDLPPDSGLHARALLYRTDDMAAALAQARAAGIDLGEPLALSRGEMTWSFSVRADGALPHGGAGPMLLQWDRPEPHPAATMPDLGIRLIGARVTTPDPGPLRRLYEAWAPDMVPEIAEGPAALAVTLSLPDDREVTI